MNIFKYINNLSEVSLPELISVISLSQAKRVNKPWGFEIWISDGTTSPYAFKIIALKKGTKTSLQYHEKKTEHNFVLEGKVKLYYQDEITKEIISTDTLSAGHIIQVRPPAIHRIEAITDVVMIEASSTELDDVIRLSDDYKRGNGKIESEHQSKKK